MIQWLIGLFSRQPVRLAIVRRYTDANGNYVGELYKHDTIVRKADTFMGYHMIGVSLDSLMYDFSEDRQPWGLDTRNDFLAPMPTGVVRVGALEPRDNDAVRTEIGRIPRRHIRLEIQNGFIEQTVEHRAC